MTSLFVVGARFAVAPGSAKTCPSSLNTGLAPFKVITGAEKADAVLVSQVVTQRDAHLQNTRAMSAAFREALPEGKRPLLIVGGPRFDELATAELGVDRIFGRGTTPREVASYLVHALVTGKASAI